MKSHAILIGIIVLLLILPNLIITVNGEETTNVKITLFQSSGNHFIEKNIPLDQAEKLIKSCTKHYSNPNDNKELINLLSKNIFNDNEFSEKEIKDLLTPPTYFENNILKYFPISKSTSFASELFCSISSGGSGRTHPFLMLPRPRLLMSWIGNNENDIAITTVGSITSDKGFIATGGQNGYALGFIGVGLTYGLPFGRVYGFTGYSLMVSVNAEDIEHYPPNKKPIISSPNPPNNAGNMPLSLSELSFRISDPDNDLMSYSVSTNPYIGIGSGTLKREGTYSISVSNIEPSTTYTWTVEVNDGEDTSTESFTFSTIQLAPSIENIYPSDYGSVSNDISIIQFDLSDGQGDLMNYTVETSPDIGSKQGIGVSNGTIQILINSITANTWYKWYVNVTDGMYWTRESFSFYTGHLGELIAHWTFDNRNAQDISGNNFHGSINGVDFITGKKGYGAEIKENTDRISSISQKFDDTIDTQMTLAAWIFPYDGYITKNCYIFDNREYSQTGGGIILEIIKNNKVAFILNEVGENQIIKSSSSIPINTWTHVAVVFNHDSRQLKMYINGVENNVSSTYKSYKKSHYNACIGNNHWADGNWRPFNGILDEIIIYDRALSDNEIMDLYNN